MPHVYSKIVGKRCSSGYPTVCCSWDRIDGAKWRQRDYKCTTTLSHALPLVLLSRPQHSHFNFHLTLYSSCHGSRSKRHAHPSRALACTLVSLSIVAQRSSFFDNMIDTVLCGVFTGMPIHMPRLVGKSSRPFASLHRFGLVGRVSHHRSRLLGEVSRPLASWRRRWCCCFT